MEPRTILFAIIFGLIALQMLLGLVQVRRYQRAVNLMRGSGLLGIGQRRGVLRGGEILILSYDRSADRVVDCMSMKGYTIFAKFEKRSSYTGMTLDQVRELGVALDAKEFRFYRKRHPYNPKVLSKKKGALIQAVEAIDLRIRRDLEKALDDD